MLTPVEPGQVDDLSEHQRALLELLHGAASDPAFQRDEPFLAIRVGLAGVSIIHSGAAIGTINDMTVVDELERRGFLDLCKLPSGTRQFRLISGSGINGDTPPTSN